MDVIYKLTSPNGKVYIGRTKNFEKRMGEHKNASESNRGDCKIHQAIRKYGWDNVKAYEQWWINRRTLIKRTKV